MPASIELNIGHGPSPRRAREAGEGEGGPYRIVFVGDFSGKPTPARPPLARRRGARVDVDNFERVFAGFAPEARIAGLQDTQGAELRIALASFEDLHADQLAPRLPARPLPSPASPAPQAGPADEDAAGIMRRLLGGSIAADAPARAAPAPRGAGEQADRVVDDFIRQLVGSTLAPPAAPAVVMPAAASPAAALLRHVLRDPAWRSLECAWRGVDRFVRGLDMADGRVRLELLDVRADELLDDLVAASGDPARSGLCAALEGDGGGCDVVVSLEEFGPGTSEMSLLGGLAALAAAHGAVLLAGAAPALAAVATSEEPEAQAAPGARLWQALRASALAPSIGLCFARLLARLPYGPRQEPVSAFPFDELADLDSAALHEGLLWRSAAPDVARLLAQSAAGGDAGLVLDELPGFVDRSGDEPRLWPVAELWLSERQARALQSAGFIALSSDRRRPEARVPALNSIAPGGRPL